MLRTPTPTRPRTLDALIDPALMARLSQLDVSSRKIFAGKLKGERRSKKRGESVEFADHRPYVVGDDLRHIDWNIFGRLDRLFLKLFLEEEDLALSIVIDSSASMDCGEPSKFLFAQRLATALAYIGLVNLNRVTLTALGAPATSPGSEGEGGRASRPGEGSGSPLSPWGRGQGEGSPSPHPALDPARADAAESGIASTIRNLRGRRRTADLARWICSLEPAASSNFTEAAKRIALTRTGKGVMLVISDFFFKEGYEHGLRYLLGRGYDLFALQVLSPQEVNPTLGGDLRLRDVEDGDQAEVTISAPLLKRYRANLAAYCDALRAFCARREIVHMTVPSDTPIDTLVLDHLRARGMLR